MTDHPLNDQDNKIKIAKVVFESMKANSLSIMNSAVLSLFSTGRTTGVVIESGQGCTYSVPIIEGLALPHGIQTIEVAG